MDFKSKIVDEVYDGLKSTFLTTGKGRRPALPHIHGPITRRLLVQLFFLKEEGSRTWTEVQEWLSKIKPDLGEECLRRCRAAVEATQKDYIKQTEETVNTFLESPVDLDFISNFLSELGVTRTSYLKPKDFVFNKKNVKVTNRLIVELFRASKATKTSKGLFFQWISLFLKCEVSFKLERWTDRTVKAHEKLLNNKSTRPDVLNCFYETLFTLPSEERDSSVNSPNSLSSQTLKISSNAPIQQVIVRKCSDCENVEAENKSLKELIVVLQNEKADLYNQVQNLEHELHFKTEKFVQDIKKLQTTTNISQETVSKLKNDMKNLNEKNKRFTNELRSQILDLEQKIQLEKTKKKEMRRDITKLKKNVTDLTNKLIEKSDLEIEVNVKGGKYNVYSDDVRKTAVSLVCDAGVAAVNVKKVIEIVAQNIFHYVFNDNLPSMQTVINMVDEGYVLSQIQVMEGVLQSDNLTLHSDGTSRDHKKIVGHQLSLSNGETFYLGYVPVASENANTLLDLSLIVLQQLFASYSDFAFIDTHELMKTVLSKITSLMTDRASAMKSYGTLFEKHVKSELGEEVQVHFLHCNAHYLLGIVSACEKAVSAIECEFVKENGSMGRDKERKFSQFADSKETATFRLLRTTCDVLGPNGDQKNGCRMDWVSFCDKSFIPSFKGNRFNCHFEAAAAIIYHFYKIKTFFTSGILNAPNLKIESVSLDVQDSSFTSIVCCLAFFFLKVTGPFWKLVNSSVKYTDFHVYVKMMDDALSRWCSNPEQLRNRECCSIFDEQMSSQSVMFDAVHDFASKCDFAFLNTICKCLCKEVLIVTRRQLVDFINDGYFTNMSTHAQEQLRHCPLTNLIGESAFGDFDFDISKRRNATLHNRSAVHCIKRNKTTKFLGKKSQSQISQLLKVARKRAPVLRKKNKELEVKMKNAKKEKFIENQEQKIAKEINDVGRRAKLTESVKNHGGPLNSQEELDVLLKNLESKKRSKKEVTECIKAEIRFHKFVVGHKNLKLGSLDEMVSSLRNLFKEGLALKRVCCELEDF